MALTRASMASVEALIRDSGGLVVTLGSYETYAHFDEADEDSFFDARVKGGRYRLTIETGTLGVIANGDTPSVDGTTYEIRDWRRIGDGAMTAILLANG